MAKDLVLGRRDRGRGAAAMMLHPPLFAFGMGLTGFAPGD